MAGRDSAEKNRERKEREAITTVLDLGERNTSSIIKAVKTAHRRMNVSPQRVAAVRRYYLQRKASQGRRKKR